MMCKRKSSCLELTQTNMPPSPKAAKSSSSGEWLEFSSSSSSTSSVSYTSKMANEEGTCVNAPETKAMDLVVCPQCFMYVMLSEDNPKCPKCNTTS